MCERWVGRAVLECFPCVYFTSGFLDDDDDEPNLGARRRCVANESHLRQSVLRVRFSDEFMLWGGARFSDEKLEIYSLSRRNYELSSLFDKYFNVFHFRNCF